MKVKIMAILLAAGLVVTGAAMTAQAAVVGTQAENGCEHAMNGERYTVKRISDYDARYHIIYYDITYYCTKCGVEDSHHGEAAEYEYHDYENIYLENGTMYSYCIVCGARDSY